MNLHGENPQSAAGWAWNGANVTRVSLAAPKFRVIPG
jgi:hypothetical protein